MNIKIYHTNGLTSTDPIKDSGEFYITEYFNAVSENARYVYPGDEIFYELDGACVKLYDLFQKKLFPNADEYYMYQGIQPMGIMSAGLDSDIDIPKDSFSAYFEKPLSNLYTRHGVGMPVETQKIFDELDKKKYRYAYLADCQSMISSLQELILSSKSSFIGFYQLLSEVPVQYDFVENYHVISTEGRMVFSMLSSLIISLYSTFDILTKICYELEHLKDCDNSYPRLASTKKLFGDKKKLEKIDIKNTIFEKNRNISIIENLRNELVHNATWEMNPKVFIRMSENEVREKYIFCPDFDEGGNLITFRNRKRFFADGKKINEELPSIYMDVIKLIYNTVMKILKSY